MKSPNSNKPSAVSRQPDVFGSQQSAFSFHPSAFLVLLIFGALLCALSTFFFNVSSAQAQTPSPSESAQSRSLTPQERRGKAIYLRGASASGREMTALMGEIDVPASTLTCAGCHGVEGQGKTEGGVTAGNLTWQHLVKPYGHTHPSGRKHGAFDEASFIRALTTGIDPSGNTLLVAMPRYRMSAEDLADLVAYLKRIETDRDPGLAETTIRVGTQLPSTGALADTGRAMREVLTAYFDDVNSRGGIYNRKIELRFSDAGAEPAASAAALKRFLQDEQIFALVSGVTAGADREIAAVVGAEEVPLVGASTLTPPFGFPLNRYAFYLLPGFREQGRALVNFAATKPELKKTPAAVIYLDSPLNSEAAASIEEQAKKSGWTIVLKQPYAREKFDAAALVSTLRERGAGAVFFLGGGGTEKAFMQESARVGWTPSVFLLGALVAQDLLAAVPPVFQDKIFLSFPTVPSDITPAGMQEFRALLEKHKLAPRHTAAQLSAFAAAKLLIEGLQRAGRDVSREKLVTALEGLYDFETGLTPRLTFGPNRRVGAQGAYMVTIDTEKKQFVAAAGWVAAN
ncbi:MAG TPA: ABC transporter substrate-binding protein [Pyrinomonadaceae bacterium]